MAAIRSPQSGIFALGTAAHAYLEFDASEGKPTTSLVRAIDSLREPRTTMGGVNLVAGVRPEAWREALPDDAPADLAGFKEDVAGIDGFRDAGHAARRGFSGCRQRLRRDLRSRPDR